MRKIIISTCTLIIYCNSFCQLNSSFEKDTVFVERDKNIDQVIHLVINITGISPPVGPSNTINLAINPAPATTMAPIEYSFMTTSISVIAGIRQIDCPITIMHGENAGSSTLYISIQLSYTNPIAQQKSGV